MNNVIEQYQQEGYYLAKKIFKPKQAQEAADWLRSQNLKKLAKTVMDQSPGDDLAKYQSIHNGDFPIAKAKLRYEFYKNKYEKQLKSNEIIFNNPPPKEEIEKG
jgi:hypothetical protein